MRTIEKLTDNIFLNIKKAIDPQKNIEGYLFAERLGKDSIAFICYDRKYKLFLINREYKPPVDEFIYGAFGGSIDKNESLKRIVKDEVKQEAGFVIDKKNIKYLGNVFVSTQMNQFCFLYIVFVDKDNQKEREPENKIEEMASTIWVDEKDIWTLNDWKAITILSKAKAKNII